MDNAKAPSDQLQDEQRLADEAFRAECLRLSKTWQFGFGKVGVRRKVHSRFVIVTYIIFNLACVVAGFIFIFHTGALQALGIALLVGGLFSFGAFVAQFWAIVVGNEIEVEDRAYDQSYKDIRYAELQRLGKIAWDLSERTRGSGD